MTREKRRDEKRKASGEMRSFTRTSSHDRVIRFEKPGRSPRGYETERVTTEKRKDYAGN